MQKKNNKRTQDEKKAMKTIGKIGQWTSQPKMYLLDFERERVIYEVQHKMQEILDDQNIKTKIEIKPCPLGMGDVVIKFEVDDFTIRNITKFIDAIKEMKNFEIYPTKNGIMFAGIITNVAKIIGM